MSIKSIKKDILTVESFKENRPDMSSYQDAEIQSAIYQTATLLNAKCNGMISKVWYVEDTNNEFYRTDEQKEYIIEAFIVQTQYTLNLGNDFSVGSESFSSGSFSSSFQRPIERKELAPGVEVLLQSAKVYSLQSFNLVNVNGVETCNITDGELNNYITENVADKRYVEKYQPNANVGSVCVVDQGKVVSFADPSTINFNNLNAQNILDPQDLQYKPIDKVNKIAFFGKNMFGPGSAVERGEMYNYMGMINLTWNPDSEYRVGQLINYYQFDINKVTTFYCLANNKNINPMTHPDRDRYWRRVGTVEVDLNELSNLTYDKVVAKYDGEFNEKSNELNQQFENQTNELNNQFTNQTNQLNSEFTAYKNTTTDELQQQVDIKKQEVDTAIAAIDTKIHDEVETQLDALPTVDYVNTIFKKDVWYYFENETQFNVIKNEFSLVEGTDYVVFDNGTSGDQVRFLGHGNESLDAVGSNKIIEANIPQKEWRFSIKELDPSSSTQNYVRNSLIQQNHDGQDPYYGYNIHLENKVGRFGSTTTYPQYKSGDFYNAPTTQLSWSYGVQAENQQQFIPKFRPAWIVKFLRDINEVKHGVVRNIQELSNFKGEWNSTDDYKAGDVVSIVNSSRQTELFYALVDNTNINPVFTAGVNPETLRTWYKLLGRNDYTALNNAINQINTHLNSNDAQIATLLTESANNTTAITTLDGEVVKKASTTPQTISSPLIFDSNLSTTGSKIFTTEQAATSLVEVTKQEQKTIYFDFIQPTNGFRNYTNLVWRIKNGSNAEFVNFLTLKSGDVNRGLKVAVENNLMTFQNGTRIANVATPTENNDAANKAYVDNKSVFTRLNLKEVTTAGTIPNTEQTTNEIPSGFFENDKLYTVILSMQTAGDKKVCKSFSFYHNQNTNWWCSETFRMDADLDIAASNDRVYKIVLGGTATTNRKFKIAQVGGTALRVNAWRLDIIKMG